MRWSPVIAIVTLLVVLGACGGAEDESYDPKTRSEMAAVLLDGASPFQRQILGDGEVTAAEYEAAVLATMDCVSDAGYEVLPAQFDAQTGSFEFFYRSTINEEGVDVADQQYEACHDEYLERVDSLYFYDPNLVPVSPEDLARCLRSIGVEDVPDNPSAVYVLDVVEEHGEPATKCVSGS